MVCCARTAAEQIPRLATPVRAKPAQAGDPGPRRSGWQVQKGETTEDKACLFFFDFAHFAVDLVAGGFGEES